MFDRAGEPALSDGREQRRLLLNLLCRLTRKGQAGFGVSLQECGVAAQAQSFNGFLATEFAQLKLVHPIGQSRTHASAEAAFSCRCFIFSDEVRT